MKSTVVFLLCSLLLAFACQFGYSDVPIFGYSDVPIFKHIKRKAHQDLKYLEPNLESSTSMATNTGSAIFSTSSIFGLIKYAIGWMLVPFQVVDFLLQIALTLCGVPFLAGLVPIVTRTGAIMYLSLFFVSYEKIRDFVVPLARNIYTEIRPILVDYIPHYEYAESVASAVRAAGNIVMSTGSAIYSGASKSLDIVQEASKTTAELANAAIDAAKDAAKNAAELAKKAIETTLASKKLTPAEMETARHDFAVQFNSRDGTLSASPYPISDHQLNLLEPMTTTPDDSTLSSPSDDILVSAE